MTPTDDNSSQPTPISIAEVAPVHHGVVSRLRNYFLTGLILVGPIYITINLTWWFVNWVDDAMRPFIPVGLRTETYLPFRMPGYGLIIALFALTLLGFLTAEPGRPHAGRVRREPAQPHADRAADLQDHEADFRDAVLESPGRASARWRWWNFRPACGRWCSWRRRRARDVAERLPGDDYVSCFLPCTPNPTTGFFFYAPRSKVIELDITVEQAMTLIMSAGMVQPSADAQKKLTALAADARVARPSAPALQSTAPAK